MFRAMFLLAAVCTTCADFTGVAKHDFESDPPPSDLLFIRDVRVQILARQRGSRVTVELQREEDGAQ